MVQFLIAAVTVAVVFLAGLQIRSRIRYNQILSNVCLHHDLNAVQDLDAYLAEQESQFSDIIPNTQKKVIWAGRPNEPTEFSVVYIHGFSATRQETAPLSEQVAKALGANLYYTRMTGHGRTGQAMARALASDWLNDALEAYEIGTRLGEKVIMIGCSTGGTALAWLAQRAGAKGGMKALYAGIFLSPNFRPKDPFSLIITQPAGLWIARRVIGENRIGTPENDGHKQFWTTTYPVKALLPMMELVCLVRRLDLSKVSIPSLMIYSPHDTVVHVPSIVTTYKGLGSFEKKLVPFSESADSGQHIPAGDIFSPGTTDALCKMIVSFVTKIQAD